MEFEKVFVKILVKCNSCNLVHVTNIFFSDSYSVAEKPPDEDPFSVAECVVGKDGQIYRGRFKPVSGFYRFLEDMYTNCHVA